MKWNWEECSACTGMGKVWPFGPDAPAERCPTCRGLGRLCTVNSGFLFNELGKRIPGKSGLHPLGDCLDCCGMLSRVIGELNNKTIAMLDVADQNRSQRREFEGKFAQAGNAFEQRLQLEIAALTRQVGQLAEAVTPKQLEAPKKKRVRKEKT